MTKNAEAKREYCMKLYKCSKEDFVNAMTDDPADKFAKTFVAKASMQNQWDYCVGAWNDNELLGAIITTVSKSGVANLQLLHTFAAHRGKGVGSVLTDQSLEYAIENGAKYFRVSAEPDAVAFYEKRGFKFWGKQKSGSSLCMFKINGSSYHDGIYDDKDPVLKKALYSGRKGSLESSYKKEDNNSLEDFIE